ncbi:hypothetical protein [Actinomyces sp. ZJ308]|uniref:hypothetical protein n=1 Tax=Actinomyces sp. ZJ308 TaxID=2708342 RepID=UPI003266DC05
MSVSVEYSTPGSGGGTVVSSSSASTSVKPSCGYTPYFTGAEAAQKLDEWKSTNSGEQKGRKRARNAVVGMYPNYEEHKDDTEGRWWKQYCDETAFPDRDAYLEADQTYRRNNPSRIWVPAGQPGPAPYVAGSTLARAAWQAVQIPAPTVETNPKVGDQGATLVGMDTWVWATGDTPTSVTATASAAGTTATVTASSTGLQLSAPDGKASCTGFGVAWHQGMPEGSSPCTISFNRSSAHLGGTTPLTIQVAYSASYTATDGTSGTLPAITTTNTVNLPVAEVQTLNTNSNNPRQN